MEVIDPFGQSSDALLWHKREMISRDPKGLFLIRNASGHSKRYCEGGTTGTAAVISNTKADLLFGKRKYTTAIQMLLDLYGVWVQMRF